MHVYQQENFIKEMAERYIWWKSPEIALQHPKLIISKVMDIGDYHDIQKLAGYYSDDYLRVIVLTSEPGAFRPRSWVYWNYRLGLATPGHLPAPPVRQFSH